jgi:Na+/H+ antiporter NhaD/arsenite permease-like protein
MTELSLLLKASWLEYIKKLLKKDLVFTIALVLALASCLVSRPKLGYIDFRVLACLFNLMVVIKAFEELHILDSFATVILNKCSDSRKVSLVLILMSFFSSMLVTNDIALLTFVPLTLIISKKSGLDMLFTVILQTLAANIGSSLTPMGNPQNLFIYSFYQLSAVEFFLPVILFSCTGLLWLFLLNRRTGRTEIDVDFPHVDIHKPVLSIIWAAIFVVIILSVFRILDYKAVLVLTVAAALVINRELLGKVDYQLLLTFVCFFIFVGNISSIPAISRFMESSLVGGGATYFISIVLSQFISNVPCAVLLSGFTDNWKELLLGVNIGGMGTIIASLASLISYKLFTREHPSSSGMYMVKFSLYSFLSLIIFTVLNYFLHI